MNTSMIGLYTLAVKSDMDAAIRKEKQFNANVYELGQILGSDMAASVRKEKQLNLGVYITARELRDELEESLEKFLYKMGTKKPEIEYI